VPVCCNARPRVTSCTRTQRALCIVHLSSAQWTSALAATSDNMAMLSFAKFRVTLFEFRYDFRHHKTQQLLKLRRDKKTSGGKFNHLEYKSQVFTCNKQTGLLVVQKYDTVMYRTFMQCVARYKNTTNEG